jgi:hypothetical protein
LQCEDNVAGGALRLRRRPPGVSKQIADRLINAAVLGEYPDCCSVDDLASSPNSPGDFGRHYAGSPS